MSDEEAPDRDQKPTLVLMRGKHLSFDALLEMFRRLTGREPTSDDMAKVRTTWVEIEEKRKRLKDE
jgi:hypothetical protein